MTTVVTFGKLSQQHTTSPVSYPQTPPVGGPHSPVWQTCGFYDKQVANENAVHSMEHGSVWIAYDPSLPVDQIAFLKTLVPGQDHLLITPYAGLPAPMVASAWSTQLQIPVFNPTALKAFIAKYEQGPQTPEPGATCAGGIGTPVIAP